MANLKSTIQGILFESNDVDVSGKYSLFTLYSDNTAILHLFEDRETFEIMKHKFTSNDNIKRLGASKLPENTTFKKLSESIKDKFNVPKERFSVRTHGKMVQEQRTPPISQNVSKGHQQKNPSIMENVLRGRERFSNQSQQMPQQPMIESKEPSINSFRPAVNHKIDLSRLNDGERPMLG